jgi:prepilin-type processing-associated H-X9-DG protein
LNIDYDLVEQAVKDNIQPDRHLELAHYLYADGHVDSIASEQIDTWIDDRVNFAKPEL